MFENPKRETCFSSAFRASPYLYSAALLIFMRRTTISHFSFLISHFGFLIRAKLSTIKEQHALRANLKPILFEILPQACIIKRIYTCFLCVP